MHGRVTAVLLTLPSGNDSAAADARLTLDPLQLEPVIEAKSGEQLLVLALEECPAQAEVDVLVEVLQDCRWQVLAGGRPQLQVRWSRLLDCLSGGHSGQPVLTPAASWARRRGVSSAIPRFGPWRVRYTIATRPAGTPGKTCGHGAVKVTVSPSGRSFRLFAAGAASWHQCGCTNAPLSRYVSPATRGLVGGGLRQGGRYDTRDGCPRARGR